MAWNRYPSAAIASSSATTTSSASLSMMSVRSPPLPRVPVSRARSAVLGVASSTSVSPATARRHAPSQSASSAVRVEVILDLCCQTVSEEHEQGDQGGELDLLSHRADSERLLAELTPEQRAAATHTANRLVLRGAAGTGKTRVIEARFRWLIDQGCAPERIGLLVPTSARAAVFRERLETALELGYDELYVFTPAQLASLILRSAGAGTDPLAAAVSAGDRLAMLVERIAELSLQHHDFGGRRKPLLAGFIRRIDRLKVELVGRAEYLS